MCIERMHYGRNTVRILSAAECRILLQHCPDCCDLARPHGRDHLWLGCHRCPPIGVHAYESENSSMAENAPARRSEIANAQGSTTMISLQGGRMRSIRLLVAVSVVSFSAVYAQQPALAPGVQKYVRVNSARVILTHVRVIDGTGKPAVEDQNVTIEGGKISAIQAGADIPSASGTTALDLRGYSVMPGIVGMHDHMYYLARPNFDANWNWEQPPIAPQMSFSAPRLYLAGGVTTMRTTGSIETYADLNLKRLIDAGQLLGPHLDVTGPYLEGPGSFGVQLHELTSPDDARQTVNYWADRGVTSFKAYMNITRAELGAAIEEAHKRRLKVTGHLCSITY